MYRRLLEQLRKLGERVRQRRKALGLKSRDVAEYLGMSETAFARLERSQMIPTVFTVVRLSTILRASTDYLLGQAPLEEQAVGGPPGGETGGPPGGETGGPPGGETGGPR